MSRQGTRQSSLNWRALTLCLISLLFCLASAAPFLERAATPGTAAAFMLFGLYAVTQGYRVWCGFVPDQAAPTPSAYRLTFDDSAIKLRHIDGAENLVAWEQLTKVVIITTDQGPFVDDVFWGLQTGEGGGIVYSQYWDGAQDLLHALQARLAGFDNRRVIAAMGSTVNAQFVVWEQDKG